MAIKDKNKTVQVTLTPYHQSKMAMLRMRTKLSTTQIIQRMIERQEAGDIMGAFEDPHKEKTIKPESP